MNDDKRQQIVRGVWRVIAESGLGAVSFRSVAGAAGVSAGRVQHYFASKQELIRASAAELIEAAAEATPAATGDASDPKTLQALLLHGLGPAGTSRPGTSIYYSYIAASVADPWIANMLAETKVALISQVERCLSAQLPELSKPADIACELALLADGAVQAVFLGALDADKARQIITSALKERGLPQDG